MAILTLPIKEVPHAGRVLVPIRMPNDVREKLRALSHTAKINGVKISMNAMVYTAVVMYLAEFVDEPLRNGQKTLLTKKTI